METQIDTLTNDMEKLELTQPSRSPQIIESSTPSFGLDTTHDYMSLIYKEVAKFNEPPKDIYVEIREDFAKFLKSDKFENKFIDPDDEIYCWCSDYADAMTQETKNAVYIKYGMKKLFTKLKDIASDNCYYTFDEFMEEEEEIAELAIIRYIIKEEILKDMIEEFEKTLV